MKRKIRKRLLPKSASLAGRSDDKDFTSYDTTKQETATPQKVREGNEASGELARQKKAEGK